MYSSNFTSTINKLSRCVLLIISLFMATYVYGAIPGLNLNGISTSNILPPEQAFNVKFESRESQIQVAFTIAPGYYIYRDRLSIDVTPKAQLKESIKLPEGIFLVVPDGDTHKEEEILNGTFTINVALLSKSQAFDTSIKVSLQGCDGKSICYPPQHYTYLIKADKKVTNNSWVAKFKSLYTGTNLGSLDHSNYFVLLLLFFIAGCLISLTPCVYPLYPISLKTLSYQASNTKLNKLFAVLAYIHGIALVFMLVGVVAAYFGILLTSVIQSKYLIFFMVTILLVLGLSMLDLFEIKLPNFAWVNLGLSQDKKPHSSLRRYLNIFLIGITSAIFLGPCVTPPLLVAFGFIAHKGDVVFGILSLYCLTLGMNIPILLLALVGDKLLPKSGVWMVAIKFIIGLLIIALAISILYPFINLANVYLSIGTSLVVVGIVIMLLVRFKNLQAQNVYFYLQLIFMILGLGLTIYGSTQLKPSTILEQSKDSFIVTQKVDTLNHLLAASTKPTLVDIYASWCVVCNEMRNSTFKDPSVIRALKDYTALQLDITDNQAEHYKFLKQYGLYGAPALLIFNSKHQLVDTLLGFVDAKRLKDSLTKFLENNK